MKRMLAAGACAVVLSFALCVGACTSAGVMQFNGKLSEELYVSAESAARGFLENELSAEGIETEFTGYTRERALDEKECSALDLREAKEGLLEAEYGTVRYTERGETWEEACEREVCILTYSLVYRYYVLPVREGERFTRSEYAFLLENGGGCDSYTMESVTTNASGGERAVMVKVKGAEMWRSVSEKGGGARSVIEAYIVRFSQENYCIVENRNAEGFAPAIRYTDVYEGEEIYPLLRQLEPACLVRTEDGFAMRRHAEETWSPLGDGWLYRACEVRETDGKFAEVRFVRKQADGEEAETVAKFYDYGVTEVKIPDNVRTLIRKLEPFYAL